MYSLRLISVY
jgi:Tektin family